MNKTLYIILAVNHNDPTMPEHAPCYDGKEVFITDSRDAANSKAQELRDNFGESFPDVRYIVATVTFSI